MKFLKSIFSKNIKSNLEKLARFNLDSGTLVFEEFESFISKVSYSRLNLGPVDDKKLHWTTIDIGIEFSVYQLKKNYYICVPVECVVLPKYTDIRLIYTRHLDAYMKREKKESDPEYTNRYYFVDKEILFGQDSSCELEFSKDTKLAVYSETSEFGFNILHLTSEEPILVKEFFEYRKRKTKPKSKKKLSKVFPKFKYFTHPVGEGAFIKSDEECIICEEKRGYINDFCEDDAPFCPWCLHDGSVSKSFENFWCNIGDNLEGVSDKEIDVLTCRTPALQSLQDGGWKECCNSICCFVDYIDNSFDLEKNIKIKNAIYSYYEKEHHIDKKHIPGLIKTLHRGSAQGYLFQCHKCSLFHYYSDSC